MFKNSRFRTILAVAGSLALTIAVSRCSPVAPSISKHGTADPSQRAGANDPSPSSGPTADAPLPGVSPSEAGATAVRVMSYRTRVLDRTTFRTLISRKSGGNGSVRQIQLDSEQVHSFKDPGSKKAEVELPAEPASGSAQLCFELRLDDWDIKTQDLKDFEATLRPSANGSQWFLTVAEGLDPEVVRQVLENLESITILLEGEQAEEPAPAPSASPNPPPSSSS